MNDHAAEKITAGHLRRDAYLYVRQSTLRQVLENTTSTDRQYGLRQRAVGLGWPIEQVVVIDEDLGRSGATTAGRDGFARLVADVGLGKAGIVIGLEVSRLARNNADWHRLLEICALTETLILDEDGLYDPCGFNDRLLLGLKGQMSEAELHLLKARLRGGVLTKARTGELICPLPVGLVYDLAGRVVLDPDQGVRDAVTHLFATFARTGSARATVKAFNTDGVRFPSRVRTGANKGTLAWLPLAHHRVLQVLHNPRYAGAFTYGRRRQRRGPDGRTRHSLQPREAWISLIPDAHPGYITWDTYEDNLARLAQASQAYGHDRRASPPREGPALLQGLVICGRCGNRMTVRYHQRRAVTFPEYVCGRRGIENSTPSCQAVSGEALDAAIADLLLATVTPVALEVALTVQAELEDRANETDTMRRQHVERARLTAERARHRYMAVDPTNRLVAANLEADWNDALRALTAAQDDYEHQTARATLSDADKTRIAKLATDFPALWSDPKTPQRERKRMTRLLIDDVTLTRRGRLQAEVRFKGGTTTTLDLPLPLTAADLRRTDPTTVTRIDRLLDDHTDLPIAAILNSDHVPSGTGQPWNPGMVRHVRDTYQLRTRQQRLADRGLVNLTTTAKTLGVSTQTIKRWHHETLITGEPIDDKGSHYYHLPAVTPHKKTGRPPKNRPRPETDTANTSGGAV